MVTKQVRFLTPVIIEDDDSRTELSPGFWRDAKNAIEQMNRPERRARINGAPYYGDGGDGGARAYPYIRVGRIRTRADWPGVVDDDLEVRPLRMRRGNLFEAAYLVPFGTENRVAFMTPLRGYVSIRAVERWLTDVLDLSPLGQSIELLPEIDRQVLEKLAVADGVAKLSIRVPHDADLELPGGQRSQIENAVQQAVDTSENQIDVEMTFSFGRRHPGTKRLDLLDAVRRLSQARGPDKLEVSMILEDADGVHREQHDLISDRIAIKTEFDISDDQEVAVDDILEGIHDAITEFRARF